MAGLLFYGAILPWYSGEDGDDGLKDIGYDTDAADMALTGSGCEVVSFGVETGGYCSKRYALVYVARSVTSYDGIADRIDPAIFDNSEPQMLANRALADAWVKIGLSAGDCKVGWYVAGDYSR